MVGDSILSLEDVKNFQKDIALDFDIKDEDIIAKRWKAMEKYFENNLEECVRIYREILERVRIENQIEQYFKDDILIDGRNIERQNESSQNKYMVENEFQKEINKNKHKLANPIYDRIKTNIYETMNKNIFKYKSKGKNTVMFGFGLESICNEIQNLIYLTVFYGSITHFNLCRKLIAEVLYLYAETFEDESLYGNALKLLALSNNFKEFEQLFNWLKNKTSYIYSEEFINQILKQENSVLEVYKEEYCCLIYKVYGKYLSEENFSKLEGFLIERLKISDNLNIEKSARLLNVLKYNIGRFNNKFEILNVLFNYIEKKYVRFYTGIVEILNVLDICELQQEEYDLLVKIIDRLIPEFKKYSLNILGLLIDCKIKEKHTKYDAIIFENESGAALYNITSGENNYDIVKYIIDDFEQKANQREKQPAVFCGYLTEYTIGRDSFAEDNYTNIETLILEKYIPLVKNILSSVNQTRYEKIRQMKILAYLLLENYNEKYIKLISDVITNIDMSSPDGQYFKKKSEEDLYINLYMLEFLIGKKSQDDIINVFYDKILKSDANILEVLECFDIIEEKLVITENNMQKQLYFIFLYCYNKNFDIEVKCASYALAKILLKTSAKELILNLIKENSKKCMFDESKEIIRIISDNEVIEDEQKTEIKELLLQNNNYNIRKITDKYL